MRSFRITRYGASALLIDFSNRIDDETLAFALGAIRALEDRPIKGLKEVTPAYGSLLLEFVSDVPPRDAVETILKDVQPIPLEETPIREIPVCYDGPDLEALGRRNGLSPSAVAEIHSAPIYRVYMIGFSPGFPYLGPLDPRLHAPRMDSPRVKVPAGSVAIGGEHTGIYSIDSPGGWWLIGRTPQNIFSAAKAAGEGNEEAFFLRQGDRVRFAPFAP